MPFRAAARLRSALTLATISFVLFAHEKFSFVKGRAHTVRDRRHRRGFQAIDSIYAINLESRPDRLEHINAVLGSVGVSEHTIVKGIPHSCGILGCGLSHAVAVAECIDSKATTCAIFEDDFELVRDPDEAKAAIDRFFRNEPPYWEVLMLSANAVTPSSPSPEFSHLQIINAALTASGYVVHKSFAPALLQTFMEASYRLSKSNCSQTEYAHDVLWKKLQQSGKWFALKPLIGKQKASYSDIEKKHVDYNVRK